MLYIFGICERCKEPLELRLKYLALDKNADITTQLVLYHRPKAIGSACACGGRIRIVSVSEVHDDFVRTLLPVELWETFCEQWRVLYEKGMSLRAIADMFNVTYTKVHYELAGRARRHKIQALPLRRVGRPRKSNRIEVTQ
jgi:hypothetical protein